MPRIFATYCEPFHTSAKIVSGPRQDVLKVSLCRCSQGVGYGPGTRWSACQKRRSKGNCGSPPMTRDRLGLISFLLLGHDEQRDQGQRRGSCDHGADRPAVSRPYYGSRRMAAWLATPGQVVNRTPWAVYRRTCVYGDDRRCRPAALPPPARKTGKCSPSTTSPQPPPTQGVDIDEVNGRLVKPAVTITAIGADIETGKATP